MEELHEIGIKWVPYFLFSLSFNNVLGTTYQLASVPKHTLEIIKITAVTETLDNKAAKPSETRVVH